MDSQQLESKYVCIRGDIYNRLINYLANEFAYAKIFQPMEDLKLNAFEVDASILVSFDPSIMKQNVAVTLEEMLKRSGATGFSEAQEADKAQLETEEKERQD